MPRLSTIALLTLLLTTPARAAAGAPVRLAVLDLKAETAIAPGTVKMLNELLLTEFQEEGGFQVLGRSDIDSMLDVEEERQMLTGCVADSCLVEIGGALGVSLVVAASVGAVGERYLVSVKVLDVRAARVLKRATENVARDDTELIQGVRGAARKCVVAIRATAADAPASSGSGALEWAPWVTLGLTAAAAATGGALAGLALADQDAMDGEVQGTPDWSDLRDDTETKAMAADVMFGVAGAAAVATVVLFVLGAAEAPAAAGLAPVRGGGVATVGLRFR